jgi:ribosome-associated translation inhibitor RaiA
MQQALQIYFHGMETSEALEERIREKVAELERRCPEMTSCRVTVEKESRNLFRISLVLHRPGRDIVVMNRNGPKDRGHEDVYVALRDTFDVASRQLEELEH